MNIFYVMYVKKNFLGLYKYILVDIRNYIITLLIHSEQFMHIPGTHITLLMNMEECSYYQHIDYIITNDYKMKYYPSVVTVLHMFQC